MKKIITTIATCLTFSISFAQNTSLSTEKTTPRKNTIYFEIFGQGLINSINYDRQLIVNEKSATSVTVGFAHWGYAINNPELKESYTGIPISFNYLLRKNNHNLELGIGITQMYTQMEWDMTSIYAPIASLFSEETITVKTSGEISTTYFTPKIGYRYQQMNGGFCFRATLTPILIVRQNDNVTARIGNEVINTSLSSTLLTDNSMQPWFGISFGYTF